jgi:hypothetical protein
VCPLKCGVFIRAHFTRHNCGSCCIVYAHCCAKPCASIDLPIVAYKVPRHARCLPPHKMKQTDLDWPVLCSYLTLRHEVHLMHVQAVLTSSDSSFPSQQYMHTQPDTIVYTTTDCDMSVRSPQLCKINIFMSDRRHENNVQVISLVSYLSLYPYVSYIPLFQCSRVSLCDFQTVAEASLLCTLYNVQNYCDIQHFQ